MDTDKRVAPPISFVFYCSATHVTSQALQPKTVNKRYRGQHTFISVPVTSLRSGQLSGRMWLLMSNFFIFKIGIGRCRDVSFCCDVHWTRKTNLVSSKRILSEYFERGTITHCTADLLFDCFGESFSM